MAFKIAKYGLRWGLIDHTVVNAISLLHSFLAVNSCSLDCFRVLALVCLEIAIKVSEDKVLLPTECAKFLINKKDYQRHHATLPQEIACITGLMC